MAPRVLETEERFWSKVDRSDGCWLWIAARHKNGYGKFAAGGSTRRWKFAHRVAFEIAHGPIPEGLCVLHQCDNRPCVNPAHLFLGTYSDNARDMIAKGRGRWATGNLPPPATRRVLTELEPEMI